jgi:hypothetical protein
LIAALEELKAVHGDVETAIKDSEHGFYAPDPEFVHGLVWL